LTVNGGTSFEAEGNVLYNYGKTNLICYPAGIGTPTETQTYTLPSTVTEITNGAFAYNTHLTAIEVAAGSPFTATDGVLYKGNVLYCYPARKTGDVYDVASTVTEIKPYAFHNNNLLKAVNFCETTVPTGGTEMFGGSNTAKIMVTKGLKSGDGIKYNNTAPWSTNYINRTYEMDLANAVVSLAYDTYSYADNDYSNTPVKPAVTSVTLTTGNLTQTLRSGIDYVAIDDGSYSYNTAVGNATVTITGAGGYAGTSQDRNFTIYRTITFANVTGHYATYYANEDLAIPSGFTAYTFTDGNIDWDYGTLNATQVNFIKAKTPILLYKESGVNGTYHVNAGTGTTYTAHSDFKGVLSSTSYSTVKGSGSAVYVLKNDKFLRVSNTDGNLETQSLPANRCYLLRPSEKTSPNFAPSYLSIIIGNSEVTKIEISPENGENVDGRVWYTLDGRRLQGKPTQKGIYISNGKKIHIK